MADEAPQLLHLLKAGRILQYRQQNVALVSAPEGTEFDITYAERWLPPRPPPRGGGGAPRGPPPPPPHPALDSQV